MKKIILVEDLGVLKFRLENILTKHNFVEVEALDSKSMTFSYITYLLKDAELIIIDLDDHEINAIKLISIIRKIETEPRIPIIALSMTSKISVLKEAVSAGCTDFILKPFEDESLIFKVNKLLGLESDDKSSPYKIVHTKKPTEISEIMLVWSSDFEIGIKEIDDDHRRIIEKYEILYELAKEDNVHLYFKELTSFINDYVNDHFEFEEILYENALYDLKKENVDMHEMFRSSVINIIEERRSKEFKNADLIRISLFIKNWLIHHILIEDRKFWNFISSKDTKEYS